MMWSLAKKLKINFLLILIEALVLLPQSVLDPEPIHDGIMFGAAVAVRDGLTPNKDVFAQYGPIAPYIQGFWLKLTGARLVNLRILTASLLILIGLILFVILKNHLSTSLSFVIVILWSLTTPRWILPPNLPWSSVITTLFIMISILLFSRIEKTNSSKAKSLLIFSGAFLTLIGGMARIQLFVSFLFLLVFFYIHRKSSLIDSIYFRNWLFGGIFGLTLIFSAFLLNHSYSDYFNQCIKWAFGAYADPSQSSSKIVLVNILLLLLFPVCILIFYATYKITLKIEKRMYRYLFAILVAFVLAIISVIKINYKSFLNPTYDSIFLSQNYFSVLGYSSVTLIFLIIYKAIRKKEIRRLSTPGFLLGISTLIQLYPAHDAMHLWWITPVTLATIAPHIKEIEGSSRERFTDVVRIIFIGLIFGSLLTLVFYFATPRVSSNSQILSGMRGTAESLHMIDTTIASVNSIPNSSQVIFECNAGLYSVSSGRYIPRDLQLVVWGPIKKYDYRAGDYILRCDQNSSEALKLRDNPKMIIKNEIRTLDGRFNVLIQFSGNG